MKNIKINVSKPYSVIIENGIIHNVPAHIKSVCLSSKVAIITDDVVNNLYAAQIENQLKESGFDTILFQFKNGESSKTITTLSQILEFLAENRIRRNDLIIAVGGGVVGDIAGLSAALYMRGINIVQIPTTLLSMVDSSVGGKTAIDLINGKNMIGAFWQPVSVLCDPCVIKQLPTSVFSEGMAEVIKCNVIKDLPIIEYINNGVLNQNIEKAIELCIDLKREIVEEDEFDTKGIRNILNAGHTVAHAIEKLSNYTISHGIAVGTGLIIESQIAEKLGICAHSTTEIIANSILKYKLICNIPWNSTQLIDAMTSDKKNRDNKIVFELPLSVGHCAEFKLSANDLIPILNHK